MEVVEPLQLYSLYSTLQLYSSPLLYTLYNLYTHPLSSEYTADPCEVVTPILADIGR